MSDDAKMITTSDDSNMGDAGGGGDTTGGGGGGGGAGRVVRLHFTCHAELPVGSFLRVTGSTLWAPGSSYSDPADATPALGRTESGAFPVQDEGTAAGASTNNATQLYTSSVEMVTTPDEYPLWRTRKPVVVVIHNDQKMVQHHFYRYLVVSPGGAQLLQNRSAAASAAVAGTGDNREQASEDDNMGGGDEYDDEEESSAAAGGAVVSTSNETTGSTAVMQWEDPFGTLFADSNKRAYSAVSLTSNSVQGAGAGSGGGVSRADYRNLPYRTVDIDVSTGRRVAIAAAAASGDGSASTTTTTTTTTTAVAVDHWNMPDDPTFRPYRIREAIHEENRRKLQARLSDVTDYSTQHRMEDDDVVAAVEVNMGEKPTVEMDVQQQQEKERETPQATSSFHSRQEAEQGCFSSSARIFFVCFHLPVIVVQNQSTKQWRASWDESILAKTEGSQITQLYASYWVGTVSTRPPLETDEDKAAVRAILQEMNCIPIFLDPDVRRQHYYGFCKQVLWPAFHNIDLLDLSTCGWVSQATSSSSSSTSTGGPGTTADAAASSTPSDWDQSRLDDWWHSYNAVNMEFCQVMSDLTRKGDIVWMHDYHLSLLPMQLSQMEMQKTGIPGIGGGGRWTRKVFFLHIPFPTSQIFRELECGEKILQGMLHADVVGFHAFDHARHFLNAAKRILGLNYESLVGGLIGVNYQGNTVLVSMSNVSIEPRQVDAALMLPSVQTTCESLVRKHKNRIIIGGVDIGQRLSGTSLKLLAYERLLQDYPAWQSRVVMVQRVLLPGSRKMDEAVTTRELRALVRRIQDKFGTAVMDYQEIAGTNTMPMDQRLGLWKAADILMSTPIREGLNHWPMEYIYSHKEPEKPGVVIASEFAAISSILNGALRVNPFDIQMTITTIDKALSMDAAEREGRRYRDIEFVTGSPSDKWVRNVLRDLKDATHKRSSSNHSNNHSNSSANASVSNSQVSTPLGGTPKRTATSSADTTTANQVIDCTAAFLAREASIAFGHLDVRAVQRAYQAVGNAGGQRVIIVDFNGTIVQKEPPGKYLKREILGTSGNKPPPEVLEALALLCRDPKNTVYVVSGDSEENVLSALGHLPGLGLAVSNGARFSPPVVPQQQQPGVPHHQHQHPRRKWLTFDLGVDWDAVKRQALPVLSKFTARSNGSFVKLTSFSIGWSYYSCDPEWGSLQAVHLVLELEQELRAFDVRFVTLKGIVEIVPRKLNKGLIVKKVLRDVHAKAQRESAGGNGGGHGNGGNGSGGVDFCLCFGDDISDEKMFTSVFTFFAEMGEDPAHVVPVPPAFYDNGTPEVVPVQPDNDDNNGDAVMATTTTTAPNEQQQQRGMYSFTCAVGKKQSHASTYVNDAQEVANALVLLATGQVPAGGVPIWRENALNIFD